MRAGTPGFVGARLREAREVRGLTGLALSELIGVTPQAVSHYEHGRTTPSHEVVQSISTALRVPQDFFQAPPRHQRNETLYFRSLSSTTKSARVRASHRCNWLIDLTEYVSHHVALPEPRFPDLLPPENPLLLSDEDVEQAARDVRRFWRLGESPIGNMVGLVENNGGIIAFDHFGVASLDSLSLYETEQRRPFILVSADKGSAVRWRFDIAHELGHLLLHSRATNRAFLKRETHRRMEEQAHRFAGAFLLPPTAFEEGFFAPNLDVLRAMKPRWRVSIAMMVKQAAHQGLISEDTERRLWINLGKRGWRQQEPYDEVIKVESPRLLGRSLALMLESRAITVEDIVGHMRLESEDIERLANIPSGSLAESVAPLGLLRKTNGDSPERETPAPVIHLSRHRSIESPGRGGGD